MVIPVENLKSLSYARLHWIPRSDSGRPISPSTLWRWQKKGIAGERLHVTQAGGQPKVSQAAIKEFFDRVTHAKQQAVDNDVIDATDAELQAAGLLGGQR